MSNIIVKCKNCGGKGSVFAAVRDEKGKAIGQRTSKCYYCRGEGMRPWNFRKCPHLFEFIKTTDSMGKEIEVQKCQICLEVVR